VAKTLKNLIRLHEWRLDEKRRELAEELKQLDSYRASLQDLLEEVIREQNAARQAEDLQVGAAFAPYAQVARGRRENLEQSIIMKEQQVEEARERLAEAFKELKTYEISQANREKKEALEKARKDQGVLDEIGLNAHRMKQAE